MKKIKWYIMTLFMLCMMLFTGCAGASESRTSTAVSEETMMMEALAETDEYTQEADESLSETVYEVSIDYEGIYTSKEDVALYIYTYGELPKNFMTKKEAKKLGWEGGSLEPYAPGMCIGGDTFGNYEEILPVEDDVTYKECDIDTLGAEKRGAKRIVFSSDGDIYYTEDHYESFELLYGDDE